MHCCSDHKLCRLVVRGSRVRDPLLAAHQITKTGSGKSSVANLKQKGTDVRAPPGMEPMAKFGLTWVSDLAQTQLRQGDRKIFPAAMCGSVWPLKVCAC